MTIEEKKSYLKRAKSIDNLVNSRLLELSNLRKLSISISSPGTNETVSSSGKETASYTKIVEKIIDLENQINTEIDEYIKIKQEVKDSINNLDNNDEKSVLLNRFINNMSFDKISEEMYISERNIYRIYDSAIKKLYI